MESGSSIDVDIVFPVIHGTYCEDGTVQGLLELAMVPYVGADIAGSVIGMDKDVAKRLLRDGGIPVVPWKTVTSVELEERADLIASDVIDKFGLPLFVKPCNTGSSVGVKKVSEAGDLMEAMNFAMKYDNKILIEKAVSAREIECAVLGNEDPESSVPGEIIPRHEFYSYEAKYIDSSGAELNIPAKLHDDLSGAIMDAAVKGYKLLNCSGMARVDFFLEKNGDEFYLNEINTLPGFTSISMYPKLWEYSGIKYSNLLDKLIEYAFDRFNMKMQIDTEL